MQELEDRLMAVAELEDHGLPHRLVELLDRAGIVWIDDLERMSDERLMDVRGMGKTYVGMIKTSLMRAAQHT